MGILVVGFATKPFAFEGEKRRRNAEDVFDSVDDGSDDESNYDDAEYEQPAPKAKPKAKKPAVEVDDWENE